MGDIAYGLAMQELERGDSGVRSFCSVQGSLCMFPIHAFGSEAQKEKWLPKMAAGEAIGCFGLTEPDFGSNPSGMITSATTLDDGGFRINGTKRWITNGCLADVAIVWAKLDGGKVHGFLVPKGTDGFSTRKIDDKFSLRASVTSELFFEDCGRGRGRHPAGGLWHAWTALVPVSSAIRNLLRRDRCGHEQLRVRAQLRQRSCAVLEAHRGLSARAAEARGDGLGDHQAQCLTLRLGRLKESKKVRPAHISLAKRNNVHMALQIARTARDILGAIGIMYEYPVGRHMMNLETVYTYEGTHDIHTLIVGQDITGLPAFD